MAHEHAGHRQRMYEKAQEQGLLDWELVEMVLYTLLPRRNTVDLSHRLLDHFGSAVAVFFAPVEQLLEVKGVGDSIAKALFIMGLVYREHFKLVYDPFAGTFSHTEFLLRAGDMYRAEKSEVLDIYLLNESNRVISRHRRTDEMEGQVYLDTQWLGKLLADDEVYGVLMAHNHPNGTAGYSSNDEVATRACQMVCNMHRKVLCDHVIFSKEGVYSYYQQGGLNEISEKYSLNSIIRQKVVEEWKDKAKSLLEEAEQLLKEERAKKEKGNERKER